MARENFARDGEYNFIALRATDCSQRGGDFTRDFSEQTVETRFAGTTTAKAPSTKIAVADGIETLCSREVF